MKRQGDTVDRSSKRVVPASSHSSSSAASTKIQAAWRGFSARTVGLAGISRKCSVSRQSVIKADEKRNLSLQLHNPEFLQIRRWCKLVNPAKLAEVDDELEATIGLDILKDFCRQMRRDMIARAALGDELMIRNVLISGNLGTGKKLAARLIYKLASALGATVGATVTETTLEHLALDVRRDISCVIVSDLACADKVKAKVNAVLSNFPRHLFIFLGQKQEVEALHGSVVSFRKTEPSWLQLPNYDPEQLASITAQRIQRSGYALQFGLTCKEIQQAICTTWSKDVLNSRNAHLSNELFNRAISSRNCRLPLLTLVRNPLVLSLADFGYEQRGLDSLLSERQSIAEQIQNLVGMASLKSFLKELEAKVNYVHSGGDPRMLEGCLNVILTGNPGAGKTTAARLLFRSLHAYGLLRKDVFIERNALELKGTHIGWTCPQVQEMVQAALGGCLFLDEAYALSGGGNDGDRGDSFSDEALRTLLTETENNRSSLCVVLAGYKEGMAHLMRADPGLVRRFPTTLHLQDYSSAELACIARQVAASRYGLAFADGLEDALRNHIHDHHAHEISKHNASLAVQLVEAATARMAARLIACDPDAANRSHAVLVGSDFCITRQPSLAEKSRGAEAAITRLPPYLEPAKIHLSLLHDRLRYVALGGPAAALDSVRKMILCGNPGTDTDTVVTAMKDVLLSYGMISNETIFRSALVFLGEVPARIAAIVKDMLSSAHNCMLVLTDCGCLANAAEASRVIAQTILSSSPTSSIVMIGVPAEMSTLLEQIPSLAACFPPPVKLPDLSAIEIAQLVSCRASSVFSLTLIDGLEAQLATHLMEERRNENQIERTGLSNAALADALLQRAVGHLAARAVALGSNITELTFADFGITLQ